MSKFDEVTKKFGAVDYMRPNQAAKLREIIEEYDVSKVLEVGFFKGKSSTYIAAILEDRGAGHLVTIDRANAARREPNITQLLEQSGLTHRVEPRFAFRSYTWELQKLISANPRPQFDLCYFDGGHHWDGTGFGVLLVDMLLKPGGIIVLDDIGWSMAKSNHFQSNPATLAGYSEDEVATETVRRVWDLILPHLGYTHVREIPDLNWAVARKPESWVASMPSPEAAGARMVPLAAESEDMPQGAQARKKSKTEGAGTGANPTRSPYWRKRSDLLYYQNFRFLVRCIGRDARSMVDVGSNKSPYLEWFDWIPDRVSVDLEKPYQSEAVKGIEGNIFDLKFEQPFDLCSCMQVLEHVPEPEPFARRLLELGRTLLVSVPYRWPRGSHREHVNDPVDLEKLELWFGRKPNYHLVVQEPFAGRTGARMFAIFDIADPGRQFGKELRKGRRPL